MSMNEAVYIERNPGDLITAEDWNSLQRQIQEDIETKATEAADGVTHVASADDAQQLEGKDLAALIDEITKRVLESVRTESGYRKVFRILQEGEDEFSIIEHGLGDCPLVDVYKLQYFYVVCADDDDIFKTIATFYLHHSSEERIRVSVDGTREVVDIQPDNTLTLGIPFADMLARYNVEYTDTTSLGDLETEFWKAFFQAPNDKFDDQQYCHSPWFERCCREERDVASLKSKGDWNDLIFHVRPWKIVGGPVREIESDDLSQPPEFEWSNAPVPANVGVAHLDLNRIALWLNGEAIHTGEAEQGETGSDGNETGGLPEEFENELKVMVLLRV